MRVALVLLLILAIVTGVASQLGAPGQEGLSFELRFMLIVDGAALLALLLFFVLARRMRDRRHAMDALEDGFAFETYVAALVASRGFSHVETTKKSGDFGVDVLAQKDGIRLGVQCKMYGQPVGPKAVQEVYAGIRHYQCHVGIVATNSTFTQSARELAKSTGVLLWDREKLLAMDSQRAAASRRQQA